MKSIIMTLDPEGISNVIKELERQKSLIVRKTRLLNKRLAEIGVKQAAEEFGAAAYDGSNDVKVSAVETNDGWLVLASGAAVCFIEFGAGVYYNPSEPYPIPRPDGIVGIGEFGDGKGKRRGWWFYPADGGDAVFTRGAPASMPMYHAALAIRREIERIAREVFASD